MPKGKGKGTAAGSRMGKGGSSAGARGSGSGCGARGYRIADREYLRSVGQFARPRIDAYSGAGSYGGDGGGSGRASTPTPSAGPPPPPTENAPEYQEPMLRTGRVSQSDRAILAMSLHWLRGGIGNARGSQVNVESSTRRTREDTDIPSTVDANANRNRFEDIPRSTTRPPALKRHKGANLSRDFSICNRLQDIADFVSPALNPNAHNSPLDENALNGQSSRHDGYRHAHIMHASRTNDLAPSIPIRRLRTHSAAQHGDLRSGTPSAEAVWGSRTGPGRPQVCPQEATGGGAATDGGGAAPRQLAPEEPSTGDPGPRRRDGQNPGDERACRRPRSGQAKD